MHHLTENCLDDRNVRLLRRCMRILVIEDEALLNLLLTAELEACGWTVETAADARTALRAVTQAPFDLAILDLGLPDMPGATLLQRLQEIAPRMQFIVC